MDKDPRDTATEDPPTSSWMDYRPPRPDTSHLITETDEPVDNLFSEKQMRLLVEPLYASWKPGRPFWAAANVGLYAALNASPTVPDAFLSLDTTSDQAREYGSKCYFFWDHGKPPEVVIEIVSNAEGGELDRKLERYAKLRVGHYVVYDPQGLVSDQPLVAYLLVGDEYERLPSAESYETVEGLSLRLWEGPYEGQHDRWLRWVSGGRLVATGAERADTLAAKLRELGIDPDALDDD